MMMKCVFVNYIDGMSDKTEWDNVPRVRTTSHGVSLVAMVEQQ